SVRILVLPLLAKLIYSGPASWACILLVAVALTDLLDGWIARKYRQETDLGRFMDPLADKIFLCVCVIFLMARADGAQLNPVLAALLLCREYLVTGLRGVAAKSGIVMSASRLAKWKTSFQFIGLGFFTWDVSIYELYLPSAGTFILWISVILSYWS